MTKKVISIEAGVWWTKVALVDYRKKNPPVHQAFAFRTPEHAIEDGYIRDKDSFASALKAELAKNGIYEKEAVFTLSSSKVVTREVTIPYVKDNKISGIIDAQVRDYFPMDVSNYTISYNKMDVIEEDGQKQLKLLLVAIPDNLLSNYCTFAELAGLKVETFDYIGNGTIQLMCDSFLENAVVVQLEEQATVISILENKKLVFQRVTPYGYGATLTAVLDHPVIGCRDEYEAFEFLLGHNVIYNRPVVSDAGDEAQTSHQQLLANEAYDELADSLRYHLRIANTALEYYQNQTKQTFIGNLYLVGDGSRFAGMKQLFAQEVPLPIQEFDYSTLVGFRGKKKKGGDTLGTKENMTITPVGFLSVTGAAVHPIDAKPKELREADTKKNSLQTAYTVFAGAVLLSLVLILVSTIRLVVDTSKHNQLKARINELSYVQETYDERNQAQQEEQVYENLDDLTKTKNEQLKSLLNQLEQELPSSVNVESFDVSGDVINLNMTTDQKTTVGQMLLNFQNVTLLQNISIPSMAEAEDDAGNKTWSFTVTAYYTDAQMDSEAEAGTQSEEGGSESNE